MGLARAGLDSIVLEQSVTDQVWRFAELSTEA